MQNPTRRQRGMASVADQPLPYPREPQNAAFPWGFGDNGRYGGSLVHEEMNRMLLTQSASLTEVLAVDSQPALTVVERPPIDGGVNVHGQDQLQPMLLATRDPMHNWRTAEMNARTRFKVACSLANSIFRRSVHSPWCRSFVASGIVAV